jgi:hypothetical protein
MDVRRGLSPVPRGGVPAGRACSTPRRATRASSPVCTWCWFPSCCSSAGGSVRTGCRSSRWGWRGRGRISCRREGIRGPEGRCAGTGRRAVLGDCTWSLLGKFASRFEPMSFSVGQLLVCGLLNLVLGSVRRTAGLLPASGGRGGLYGGHVAGTVLHVAGLGAATHAALGCGVDPESRVRVCGAGRLAVAG